MGTLSSLLPPGDRCQIRPHAVPAAPPWSSAAAAASLRPLPQHSLNLTTRPLDLLRLLQQLLPHCNHCPRLHHLEPAAPPWCSAPAAARRQNLPQQSLNLTSRPLDLLRLLQQLRRLAAGGAQCLPRPALHGRLSFLQGCIPLPADMLGPCHRAFGAISGRSDPQAFVAPGEALLSTLSGSIKEGCKGANGLDAGSSGSQAQGTTANQPAMKRAFDLLFVTKEGQC